MTTNNEQSLEIILRFYNLYHTATHVESNNYMESIAVNGFIKATDIDINRPTGTKEQILIDYLASLNDITVRLMQALSQAGYDNQKVTLQYLSMLVKKFDANRSRQYLVSKVIAPDNIKNALKHLDPLIRFKDTPNLDEIDKTIQFMLVSYLSPVKPFLNTTIDCYAQMFNTYKQKETSNVLSVAQHAMHITDGLVTNANSPFTEVLENWDKGCLELFEWVSQFAVLANTLCEEDADEKDFPGVFEYDVSCMFGNWLSEYIVDNKTTPTKEEAEQELRNLSAKFFSQS